MIFLQIITGILLVPLLMLIILAFNIYVRHWVWFLGVIILGLLISASMWILFLEISYAVWALGIIYAIYLYRMYLLNKNIHTNQ